ncbi:MAG: ATP-binding cassette domain-containing protein [Myxococcales bacterium]|nr:ATP-binding cassette domain-containing protein [Myxococcales bacterium]
MTTPSPFRRILALARPQLGRLAAATVALVGTSGLTLAYPQLIREIVDGVLEGGGRDAVDRWAGLLLVLFAFTAVLTAVRMYLFTVAGERIVTDLRARLYASLVRQEIGFFDTHRTGELTNRLAADTTVVQNAATVNISMLLRYLITSLGAIGILAWTSWRLTLVMLALVPVAVIGALFYGRIARKLSRQVQDALARATEVSEETLGGIRTVRAFAREDAESARYAGRVEESFGLARRRARFDAIFGAIAAFAGYGAISGVLWYGGLLLAEGSLTMGELTSFLLYTFTVAFAIGALGSLWQDFQRAIGASERVFELIERPPGVTGGSERPEPVRGAVTFEGVDFAYPTRPDVPVLRGVDLTLAPGEVVALVGPSGGGKSTIAALLSRFYDPTAGAIRLDGHDLRALDADWLRRQIGVVAQEPVLFAASIEQNILYGNPAADPAAVRAAAAAANALGFIEALPDGLETEVGERGVQLSGGQKQRVAIARALLEDPPILVLDEATSALDAESEHLVQDALKRLMKGRTTLVIAHRLSTVKQADRIVVVEGGRVVQHGSHAELIAAGGLYRQLVERQLAA